MYERRVLDDDDGEDERGESARAEPADEGDRRPTCIETEKSDRDRDHPYERQAEDGVERDPPVEDVQGRAECDRAEDDKGDGAQHLAADVDEIRRLAAG